MNKPTRCFYLKTSDKLHHKEEEIRTLLKKRIKIYHVD